MPKPALTAAAGAAILALASYAAPAAAQAVDPVELKAWPTQVVVSVAGKDTAAVRTDVREAARYVCRNAARVGELDLVDVGWCSFKSSVRAMRVYEGARAEGRLASNETGIVLSAR